MGSSAKRSVPVALTTTTTGTAEVLEAQARIWCDTFGYLKSVALHSAIKLGVPNAMSHRGCHTRFLSQNRMLIVCVLRNQVYTLTVQKIETE
jgi:hypothetical protein